MIYVFLADGFEETEAIAPIDMLRRAKKEVVTVGVTGKTARSSHGIPVECDIEAGEMALSDKLELIVLPGGLVGTNNLDVSAEVQSAIDYCAANGIRMSAICAAPSVLGKRGVLSGKEATCYPGFEQYLTGAKVSEKKVVTDGLFTTAAGAGVSVEFGLELVKVLCGQAESDRIRSQIQCAN